MERFEALDIRNPFPGARSWYTAKTASTMDDARLLSLGVPFGLVVAGEQTAGRGRLEGRSWRSAAGESLLVTLWFPLGYLGDSPPPLLAGAALLAACESWADVVGSPLGRRLALKWPNDLLCGGRKLAGILCEAAADKVYVGIGLNRLQTGFAGEYRTAPSSLYLESGRRPEGLDPLPALLDSFLALATEEGAWWALVNERLAGKGSPASFRPGLGESGAVSGTLVGVDASGSVLLGGGTGISAFNSGELRIETIDEYPVA